MDLLPPPLTFPAVSSTLPYDITLPNDLSVDNLQRAFDIFSWATFIALNWPANSDGTPMPVSIGSNLTAERVWETWLTPDQVFKSNGSPPDVPGGRNDFVAALVPNAKPGVRVLNYTTKVLNLGAAGVEKIISNLTLRLRKPSRLRQPMLSLISRRSTKPTLGGAVSSHRSPT
jgi:hypothetical protein